MNVQVKYYKLLKNAVQYPNKEIKRLLAKGYSINKILRYYEVNGFEKGWLEALKKYLNEEMPK